MKTVTGIMSVFLLTLLSITTFQVQASEIKSDADAILALGGQMSNIRKSLEAYTTIGAGIKFRSPEEQLRTSITEYEAVIDSMEKNFSDPEIQESVKRSRTAWAVVGKALKTALTDADKETMKTTAVFVHDNIRSVIKELANMKKHLLKTLDATDGENLNAAIEIGASARRLSAHYMMKMWELDDPTIDKHWDNGVKIYTKSVELLKKSPYVNDPAFKALLDKCEKELAYFNMVWKFKGTYMPAMVHDKSHKVFINAVKMTEMILAKIMP